MDLVRLGIIYDTSQAAIALNRLDGQLKTVTTGQGILAGATNVSTGAMRRAGLGALSLIQNMQAGGMSATNFASSLGRVGAVLLGPWGIAMALGIGLLTFFHERTEKLIVKQQQLNDSLSDVKRHIDEMLNPGGQSAFSSELDHLDDQIRTLDETVQAAQRSWFRNAQNFLSLVGLNIPGFGNIRFGAPAPIPEAAQAQRLREQRARLTPESAVTAEISRYNKALTDQGVILSALNRGPFPAMQENIKQLQEHLDKLAPIGAAAADEIHATALALLEAQERLRQMQRGLDLLHHGLDTIANALEDFVVTGTLAFSTLLDNILRLLYRDFTGEIIHNILNAASGVGSQPTGTVTAGTPSPGSINQSVRGPSFATQVSFNVQATDTQSVAQFFERNGNLIAAEVARAASRSRGLRRRLLRG